MTRALVAGTVVSLIVVGFWSAAAAAIGPVPPLHLSAHHLVASYLALAAAPTGNAAELFAAVAVIYAVSLFTAAMRARTRRGR
jgi:hypothetical protein